MSGTAAQPCKLGDKSQDSLSMTTSRQIKCGLRGMLRSQIHGHPFVTKIRVVYPGMKILYQRRLPPMGAEFELVNPPPRPPPRPPRPPPYLLPPPPPE